MGQISCVGVEIEASGPGFWWFCVVRCPAAAVLGAYSGHIGRRGPLVVQFCWMWSARRPGSLGGVEVDHDRPHQILEGVRGGQVKAHLGGLLPHSGADFEDTQLDRVEVGLVPLCASHAAVFDLVQQHVGEAVQEESELVGAKTMAGGTVGVQEGLVVFDEAFHASAGTVEFFVQKAVRTIADVGDHKPRVGFALSDLCFVDDATLTTPAPGPVVEVREQPHRLFRLLCQRFGLVHQRRPEPLERLVGRLSENEIDAVSVAQVVDLRRAEVRVAPQADVRLWPDHDQMIQHALQDRGGLGAPHSATGPKKGRDQFAGVAFVEGVRACSSSRHGSR